MELHTLTQSETPRQPIRAADKTFYHLRFWLQLSVECKKRVIHHEPVIARYQRISPGGV